MKKFYLTAATALVTVFLLSGTAQALTSAAPAGEAKAPVQEMMKKGQKMQAPMQLSEEKAKLVHETMSKMHEDNKDSFEKMGALHKEMREIMKAPTFDKEAYLEKSAEIQSVHAKIAEARAKAVAEVAGKLTPEERESIERPMMMHQRHGSMMKDCMGPMKGKCKGPMGQGAGNAEE